MMNLSTLPDVTFVPSDINTILKNMINDYEQAYFEQTGENITLYPGDKIRIFLYTQALREFQLRQLIDFSAKQNLLKYSSGDYLDNLAAFSDTERLQPTYATVTEKFNLSITQDTIQTIPKGTRVVNPSKRVYFATTEDIEVPAGSMSITAILRCVTSGVNGNGFIPGQLNVLADPLPWIESVVNIDTSQGGADLESDDSLRERTRQAPEGFSVAGPSGAYEYFVKKYNQLVNDVKVSTPSPGVVDIRVLLANGEIPTETLLSEIYDYLNDKKIRPLTDNVVVNAPEVINYNITLTYYILTDNATTASTIQANVNQAYKDYITWQKSKIGRDINPSELISRIIGAGAKRVELTKPDYLQLTDIQVAIASENISIIYGGQEDD